MASALRPETPELRDGVYRHFRQFFRHAERKRRWSVDDDIPWRQVDRRMDPAVADVVESFCAVELYLPDYVGKALPVIRTNRGGQKRPGPRLSRRVRRDKRLTMAD